MMIGGVTVALKYTGIYVEKEELSGVFFLLYLFLLCH